MLWVFQRPYERSPDSKIGAIVEQAAMLPIRGQRDTCLSTLEGHGDAAFGGKGA